MKRNGEEIGCKPPSESEITNLSGAEALLRLPEQAGGWWFWDETAKGPKFMLLNEWIVIYGDALVNAF